MFLFFEDKTKFERFLINKQLNYLCFSCFPGYHLKQEKQKNEFFAFFPTSVIVNLSVIWRYSHAIVHDTCKLQVC